MVKEKDLADNKQTLMVGIGRQRLPHEQKNRIWRGGEKSFQSRTALGLVVRTYVGLGRAESL